ncbi:S8 family peptidase [Natronosporangium hydrolyticum]|uniref:S8 family peptidase n=1 Tax=Natronosporangium hydrolyticum TaxID=2811111 RepID=UPI001EFA18F6|nr:S8 family serine peptidase [Natronosporangium hydrolyticum]
MRTRRSLTGVASAALALVLAATLAATAPASATYPPATTSTDYPTVPSWTVTLITGDRVTAVGERQFAVAPAPGRDHVTFLTQQLGDDQFVIPSDAAELVVAGQLDRRLFNLTALREFGYDDRRGELPLLLTGVDGAPAGAAGVEVQRALPVIDGVAAELDKAAAGQFWQDLTGGGADPPRTLTAGVATVMLDGLRQPTLSESAPQVGAPAAWDLGLDGAGATVAVLDTGIDATHPDLADRVVGAENFTDGEEDDRDLVGHGTHVAGIVAGSGEASDGAPGGAHIGVAPGADLLDGKVCVEYGCAESWILAGMQWAAEQGADVINMSLGGPAFLDEDPVELAVGELTDEYGTLFVISAGNDGGFGSINSPGTASAALTLGAVASDDELAPFSSRGPLLDGGLKPDLTAPGVEIVAANSADGFLGEPGDAYTAVSGTSMAAPHAAGAAAILRQQHPQWGPEQLKAVLMAAAQPHPDLGADAQGAGRLDLARAVAQPAVSEPASVSFDRQQWPHEENPPQTETVTYHNHGDEELVLELAVAGVDPAGQPLPAGFAVTDVSSVTVPAGGSAVVALTVDTAIGEVDGYYSGWLTATSDGARVTTPFGVDREVESYDVTLEHIDRDGGSPMGYSTTLYRWDEFGYVDFFGEQDSVTMRVPAAEYALTSFVSTTEEETSLLAQPRVVVDGDLTIEVDARLAEPVSVSVPQPGAQAAMATVGAELNTDNFTVGSSLLGTSFDALSSGQLAPSAPVPGFASAVTGTFARPGAAGDFADTPYTYDLAWFAEGELLTGLERQVRHRDLAVVRAEHARHAEAEAAKVTFGTLPGVVESGWSLMLPVETPFQRWEFHNTDGGVQWSKGFEELVFRDDDFPEFLSFTESEPIAYQAGERYREQWNHAVFGPAFHPAIPTLAREGDQLQLFAFLYGDAAGRPGQSLATGSALVYHNGELVAELPDGPGGAVTVPPEPGEYRVEIEAERDEWFSLSTATEVVWTFHSERPTDGEVVLPASAVRFSPELDQHNTAPAGQSLQVPVAVVPQPGSAAGEPVELSVAASFDDGQTWQELEVQTGPAGQYVSVPHPTEAGFGSLRAVAVDADGNSVEQTIIRAYAIG